MRRCTRPILPLLFLASVSIGASGGVSGCKSSDSSQSDPLIVSKEKEKDKDRPEAERSPRTVALVMKTLTNPFFQAMEQGARKAEKELGIQLIVQSAADDASIEQQTAIVRQLIRDKVDAIVIVPGHSVEMIPVVKEAKDAGITIINIDNRFDQAMSNKLGLSGIPYIGVNNEQGAYLAARHLSEKLDGPTEVAIIGGDPAAQAAKDRLRGATRAFDEHDNLKLVATETAHWKIDEAYEVSSRVFGEHPAIGAVFCSNDMMGLGVIRYLEEHKKDKVLVASYDDIEEARNAIRKGTLIATINQQADEQGYQGVKAAMRAIDGETVPAEIYVDVKLVTAETLVSD